MSERPRGPWIPIGFKIKGWSWSSAYHCAGWVLLIGLWCPAALALPPDSWVVTIGNNHGDADDVSLLFAERDALEFAAVLRSLGGVRSDRVLQLADEGADAVVQALAQLNATIRATQAPNSALIVFYSGHADAERLHLGGSYLAFDTLRALVRAAPTSFRLLVVDACRSGGVSRVKGVAAAPEFPVQVSQTITEGLAIVTSSAANESSQESDTLQGSFFSHHIIQGLRGAADRNQDGDVSLSEMYTYAYDETVRSSGRTLELQHPTYAWDLKGRAEIVLTQLHSKTSHQGRLRLTAAGTYLVFSAGALVAEAHPRLSRSTLTLPPRHYRVQARRPDEYLNYMVALGSDQTVDLKDIPYDSIRYDRLVRKGGGEAAVVHGAHLLFGARGEVIRGEGITPHLALGYSAATRWFTAGLRARASRISVSDSLSLAPRHHEELAVGLTLEHFVDLPLASLGFGVLVEGAWHRQVFSGTGAPRSRISGSLGFGALLSVERALALGLALHFEAGPFAMLLKGGDVEAGREVRTHTVGAVSWWAAGGVGQRF